MALKSRSSALGAARNGRYSIVTTNCCDAWWTGLAPAHCSAERSVAFRLLSPGDRNAKMLANRYSHLNEAPVNATGVMPHDVGDLLATKAAGVQNGSLAPPLRRMFRRMLKSGHGGQVLGIIVSPVPVTVVNMLIGYDDTGGNSVFVGFDVLSLPDSPTETNVPVTAPVTSRLMVGNALSGSELANLNVSIASFSAAFATSSTLSSSFGLGTTVHADNNRHDTIVAIRSCCHHTFTGAHAFSLHRLNGQCRYPVKVGLIRADREWDGWAYPGHWEGPTDER